MNVKESMYDGYRALYALDLPVQVKHRMFTELSSINPSNWRVVGMTLAALDEFVRHGLDRPRTVCRAHAVTRMQTSREMFEGPMMDMDVWWEFYTSRDKTVIATKSENMRKEAEVSAFEVPEGLFPSRGFAFRVGKEEREFLLSKKDEFYT